MAFQRGDQPSASVIRPSQPAISGLVPQLVKFNANAPSVCRHTVVRYQICELLKKLCRRSAFVPQRWPPANAPFFIRWAGLHPVGCPGRCRLSVFASERGTPDVDFSFARSFAVANIMDAMLFGRGARLSVARVASEALGAASVRDSFFFNKQRSPSPSPFHSPFAFRLAFHRPS
jgi:hypothetical protein